VGAEARFYQSSRITSPVTFGLRRTVILVPDSVPHMDARAQEAIACHELLHVRRRDWLWTLAEEFARALFWFHPVFLRLIDRIRLTREQVVDALTVRITGSRDCYVRALMESRATTVRYGFAAPSFLKRSHLAERLALLLKEVPMSRTRLIVSLAAVATVVAVAAVLAVRWLPLETAQAPPPPVPGARVKPPPPPPEGSKQTPARRQKEEKTYRVGEGVIAPVLLRKTEPAYTQAARHRKIQGTVVLEVRINSEGVVDAVNVRRGLDPGLDNNAIAAIRRWKFKPGMKGGKPVAVAATVEVNFLLL
jgi:TonB family protein